MQSVKVDTAHLRTIVQTNRDAHHKVFIEAMEGYRKLAIEELEHSIQEAKAGRKIHRLILLEEPVDQTKQYDTILRMLSLTTEAEVTLSYREFRQYVMDEWDWMDQFVMSNSRYVSSDASNTYLASKSS